VNDPSVAVETGATSDVGATCAPPIGRPVTVSVRRPAADHAVEGGGVTGAGAVGVVGGAGVDELPPHELMARQASSAPKAIRLGKLSKSG
jgi:hypothetical protein